MKNFPYKFPVLGAALLVAGLLGWWLLRPDPLAVFQGEINEMIEQANQGEHLSLRKKLSPEMETYITNNYMPVAQALALARKLDKDRSIRYRLVKIVVFEPRDYAEIEMERSGPNGHFSGTQVFPVPFIYRDGDWLAAGAFRSERDFINPIH